MFIFFVEQDKKTVSAAYPYDDFFSGRSEVRKVFLGIDLSGRVKLVFRRNEGENEVSVVHADPVYQISCFEKILDVAAVIHIVEFAVSILSDDLEFFVVGGKDF